MRAAPLDVTRPSNASYLTVEVHWTILSIQAFVPHSRMVNSDAGWNNVVYG
jgi:hypothetical protein